MRDLLSKAAKYRAKARRHKLWQRAVSLLACVVIFITTYAQILPAVTLEAELFEPDGHVHTDACYKIVTTEEVTELDCPLELHTHTAACYDADGAPACGYADFVVHTHDSFCYDENGKLACTLPEVEEHTHTALCYPVQVDEPADGTDSAGAAHVHTEECYTETPGALTCDEEETDGHTHTEDCYVETEQLVCELEESEGHTHTDLCMDAEGLPELCGEEESEGHTHDESCYETVQELVCDEEEAEPHTHTEDCYAPAEKELTCGFGESEEEAEETTERADLFAGEDEDPQPICGQDEIELHTHTAACFGAGGAAVCGQLEVLEHQHTEDCLRVVQEASEEKVLDCAYTSSEDREDEETPADSSTDGDEDGEKPADSDSTGEKPADSDSTSEDGDKGDGTSADGAPAPGGPDDDPILTPATPAERVLAAAESYIGYKEDAEDCDIDADGEERGYTQFGAHYGWPYEKWDAMFVAYCLEEAGVEELPSAEACLFDIDLWASMLDGAGYCQTAELYTPAPGDVAFFDLDGDGTLDHVAFVEKVTDTRLFVIAGDSNDCVRRASYALTDESIVSYAVLPGGEDEPADEPDEEDDPADPDGLTGEPGEDDPASSGPMDEPQDGEDDPDETEEDDPDKTDEEDPDETGEEDKTDEDAAQDGTQDATPAGRVLAAAQAEFGYTSAPDGTVLYRTHYNDPTAPLDVLFVAYCLEQAGVEDAPSAQASGFDSEQWRAALAEAGMFRAAGADEPAPGEVLFLDKDGDGAADFVAIVEKVSGGKVHVLEMAEAPAVAVAALALDTDEENTDETTASAAASCVRRASYGLTDAQVLGYMALASLQDEDAGLTEEEQAQVDAVIELIEALPDQETLTQKMAELEEAGDEDATDAYLTELRTAAIAAYKAYDALTEAQQQKVTNAEKLLALEWLWSAETLPETDEIWENVKDDLTEKGIFPGTKTTRETEEGETVEVWTVYDTGNESTANIKATVTLPDGTTVAADHYLYIRAVAENEDYYPDEETLKAAVGDAGAYSDVQCYAIHWVHVYQENGKWTYSLDTKSVLGGTNGEDDNAPPATVQIEYLKDTAYLKGNSAHRKLMVLNSRDTEGTVLEDASTPTAVTATDTAYTGFTFTTNRGGPYVFVSKTLFEGYVSRVAVDEILDGAAPWDENNDPGNDSGDSNMIVRSYDTIQYNLVVNMAARSSGITALEATLEFEMTLPADITEAVFDTSQMLWMGDDYTIEYLDGAGSVILTQKSDGTYDVNQIVYGSDKGTASYTSTIVSQRLRASVDLQSDSNVLTGNKTYVAAIQVLNADNGSEIEPTFRVWFQGNEDNYGSENKTGTTEVKLAEKVTDNNKQPEAVKVSATARFNLELDENSNVSYKSWFDSDKGQEVSSIASYTVGGQSVSGEELYSLLEALGTLEENIGRSNPQEFTDENNACSSYLNGLSLSDYEDVFANIRYGRITGYGITLQIYNDATGDQNDASKGFKGVSLPQGAITFDLALETTISGLSEEDEEKVDEEQYYAQLWEYNENVNENTGNQGRNMYWANLASTKYASWAAPYNKGSGASYCYDGGTWSLGEEVNSDGSYPFTVSGYDLNFLSAGLQFPTHKAGNADATTGYNTYIGSFSAGYVQLLNVFPRTQAATFTLGTSVTVKNLKVSTTTADQKIEPDESDSTGYAHETNTKDNSINDSIPLYAQGGMTKANAFCNAACFETKNSSFTSQNYFLGTEFWTSGYDASAFAGQDITLVGAARINAGDYAIRHMNMLQLFDSEVLSIDTDRGTPYVATSVTASNTGEVKILYAADPHYGDGYDTNAAGMQEYISAVREEDLIYYESLDKLESAGYTCIGVLAELRNCTIYGEGGYSTVLKIPMKVSDEEKFLTKTVSTVNTVRIWTNAADMGGGSVTWADGHYDEATGKNSVDGYTSMTGSNNEHYRGEVANGSTYYKTKYENGQVVLTNSNTGGYVYGASLLILGYESTVDIEVDNGGSGSLPTYDMDKGNYTVNYRLTEISTKVDNAAGTPQTAKTNLTVLAKVDTGKEGQADQRIAIASTGYQMVAASKFMQLVSAPSDSGEVLEAVEISTDSANPTTVYYRLTDNLEPPAGEEIQWTYYTIQVYANSDTNGTQITFELTNVTVEVSVPDITFDALIEPQAVSNNDRIEAAAYISGTSDVRAYSTTNGNMDTTTIGIIKLKGTNLVKSVDKRYIELDGVFTYTVTYANTGNAPVSVYLYDLRPDPDDIRGSHYDDINSNVILRDVSAELSGEGEFTADIQFYYSTMAYTDLYDNVRVFGSKDTGTGAEITETEKRRAQIESMLGDTRLFNKLGTINSSNDHEFTADSAFSSMTDEQKTNLMKQVTGIYAVVSNLDGGKTLSITFTVETEGNKAGDLYRNIANSWLGDATEPLTSNLVETTVLSRTISGVVWHDQNLNGVRDAEEKLISDVTCTLFKLDETEGSPTKGEYVMCTTDVTGGTISTVTTGEDGAYSFEKLAAGQYIVAFSGAGLNGDPANPYVGATTYQVGGGNQSATNDAVALVETESQWDTDSMSITGFNNDDETYQYAIAYDLKENTVSAMPLHTIQQIVDGNISLKNYVELYENQDLGLVVASYELPSTGGAGTMLYIIGGPLAAAAGLLLYKAKKRRKGASASS